MEPKLEPEDLDVSVNIDAVKFSGSAFLKEAFKTCALYHREYDYRLDGSPEQRLYNRVCGYTALTGTKIGVAYDPVHSFMPACVFNVSPPDTGLRRHELDEILDLVPEYRFTKIELAHVFRAGSVVTSAFARKHLVIGKSKRSNNPSFPNSLYFGSRTSPVFARCYPHRSNHSYKIEPEFHRQWLDKHGIHTTADFTKLAQLALHHTAFYRLDPIKASAAFARIGVPVASTLRKVVAREHDIYKVLDFLRHDLGMVNALRVFTPLATNSRVQRALQMWADVWSDTSPEEEREFAMGCPLATISGGK